MGAGYRQAPQLGAQNRVPKVGAAPLQELPSTKGSTVLDKQFCYGFVGFEVMITNTVGVIKQLFKTW